MSARSARSAARGIRRSAVRLASSSALPEPGAGREPMALAAAAAMPEDVFSVVAGLPIASRHNTPDMLLALARECYAMRRRRDRHLPSDLFGEPTWDILLDLYVATRENRPVPTTSACIGADVPPTTALRWLRILEARGLVEREEDCRDGRRTFVRLSKQGLAAMDDWLKSALNTLDLMVMPALAQALPLAEAAE